MKKGRMAEIVKELQGASKMHLKQSKEIAKHIDDMKSPVNSGLGVMGKGDAYKKGELIDETDHEDLMYKSTNSPDKLISGTDYNVENVSEIQKDKEGQFMTSLDESEYYGGPEPTSSTVSNYDQGRNQTRDTLRPAIGNKFIKTYDNPIKNIEKQSLQTKYRKFKAKAGRQIRKLLGEPEPTIIVPNKKKVNTNLMR
jgi:hypothetical protein